MPVYTVVDNISSWLNNIAKKQNVPIGDIVFDFDDVISGTGPSAFTEARPASAWIGVISKPSRVQGHGWCAYLTVEAFAADQGHSNSGSHDARAALVKHHFHTSGWLTKHPRFNHPIYGEVDTCNWNAECIRAWDENTAAFELLRPEEKTKRLTEKEFLKATTAAERAERDAQEAIAARAAKLIARVVESPQSCI